MGAHDYLTKPPPSAEEVVLTVERAMEKRQLRQVNRQLLQRLETLSLTDSLTGALNRRAFDQALEKEVARARRHGHDVGLIALDVDHFKRVNDTYRHEGGDKVLQGFVRIVTAVLRTEDSLYRCGGEEFVVIVASTDLSGLRIAATRVVESVATSPMRIGSVLVEITMSAGVAALDAGQDGSTLLSRADAALYEAKQAGRNRVSG